MTTLFARAGRAVECLRRRVTLIVTTGRYVNARADPAAAAHSQRGSLSAARAIATFFRSSLRSSLRGAVVVLAALGPAPEDPAQVTSCVASGMQGQARPGALLLLVTAVVAAPVPPPAAKCNATIHTDHSIGGRWSTIKTVAGPSSVEACCAACIADSACTSFVLHSSCMLKSDNTDLHAKDRNTAGVVRGAVPPPGPPPAPTPTPAPPAPKPAPPPGPAAALAWADSFGSHMVLQQLPAPTVVWGFAPPGAKVSVQRLAGSAGTAEASATNTTAADGVWWVTMPGLCAGNETFKFKATISGSSAIEMDDVVYGDVWVCKFTLYQEKTTHDTIP